MGGFGIDQYIIVFSRFSIYIRVRGKNNDESCPTQGRRYLHSICLQIHTDYLTFSFEKKKRFLRNECKEHSFVCISAIIIINKNCSGCLLMLLTV